MIELIKVETTTSPLSIDRIYNLISFGRFHLLGPDELLLHFIVTSYANSKRTSCATVLTLAYQSLGVVYGDLSTSPLYVYKATFSGKLRLKEDDVEIFGVLSFVFWTLTIIALFKYIFIVMSADDNGEGGAFALYSLLCRNARLSLLPNQQPTDESLFAYATEDSADTRQSSLLKSLFEKNPWLLKGLLIFVLLGTCMTISDGVLTPAISVLSAVSGVKVKISHLDDSKSRKLLLLPYSDIFSIHSLLRLQTIYLADYVVMISCVILVGLFSIQQYGTHTVAFLFAPFVAAWLLCISVIGVYNIFRWNPKIFYALSPVYMFRFIRATGSKGWLSLGGVVLSITGVETMFADMGHFSAISIRIAFTCLVYPCLILAYIGEAAFLSKNHSDVGKKTVFWPVFVVATLASIVASQAAISATFSIISQCRALNCFPSVKIIRTSSRVYGQIYIPEVNWILMCLCLAVTIGIRDTNRMGHAYGLAVTTVMFMTTCLMALVIVVVWKQGMIIAITCLLFFGSIELFYVSSCIYKVTEGAWISLVLSFIFMCLMYTWNYGTLKKYEFDVENKITTNYLLSMGPSLGMVRVPGVGLMYTNVASGFPAFFSHLITNLPAFHEVLVFVCVKSVQIPHVSEKKRFVISRVGPREYSMFRCVVRYGYKDIQQENYNFENKMIHSIIKFVETETKIIPEPTHELSTKNGNSEVEGSYCQEKLFRSSTVVQVMRNGDDHHEESLYKDESLQILKAKNFGVTSLIGHSYAKAKSSSSIIKKFAINIVFEFLSRNCRESDIVLNLDSASLLEVGMIYHV
ncbi:unnamed protein product [Lupinus luteus]|uniref:Potassium transporter n=1 Tax=Lupinus luteus TaxID=3873 RepID=A0AAV1YM52_LUPLU